MEDLTKSIELPATVNSLKFATSRCVEIAAMTESILRPSKTKLIFQTLPVHMRRRVMSHNCKRLPKNLREGHLEQLKKSGLPPKQKRPSRKYRRRPANLLEEYTKRQRRIAWLETHIWHAKRFHMIERWGYRLAYAPCDKAFRACYRASSAHCLLQDISYYTLIKIKGSVKDIGNCFSKLTNTCTGLGICAKAFLNGNREGSISLYKAGYFPFGYICKVKFIWEPSNSSERCLWLFVHPATVKDVESMLCPLNKNNEYESAAKRIKTDHDKLNVEILPGRLNRFRLTGPNSHAILTRSLKCIENIDQIKSNNWISKLPPSTQLHLNNKHTYWSQISLVSSPAELPKAMVLGLIVRDPRLSRPNKRIKAVHNGQQCDIQTLLNIPTYAPVSPIWDPNAHETIKKDTMSNGQFIQHVTKTQLVPGEIFVEDPALQSIPIVLIQRSGSQNSDHKKIGYGSGWDILIPSGYALPFWHTFIMFGARSGGLRESENLAFELGTTSYLPPDSNAGRIEENRLENELKERYFRRPPSKRVNFIKLGIKCPFYCPWNILLRDWANQSTDSNFDNYFVLRDRKLLQMLQENLKHRKRIPHITESSHCLIPVNIKLSGKGSLSNHALICKPQGDDLQSLKTLFEPQKDDLYEIVRKNKRKEHNLNIKQMKRKRLKNKKLVNSSVVRPTLIKKKSREITEYMKVMRELWVPSDLQNIRNHGTRQVLGFILKGSFCFTEAKSCGVGYLAYNALYSLLDKGQNQVLIRNITSRKYRVGEVEIIQDV